MKLEEDILEQCIQQYVLEQFPTDGIEDEKIIKKLQEKIETHPFANAIWCTWGYAGTCHTSQGSEWDYVVADLNYAENFDSSWVYTALTRSQNTLCILNLDKYNKTFISDDLNLTDIDEVLVDHHIELEKDKSGFKQIKEKIGSFLNSNKKDTSELTELEKFNNLIDLIKLLPLPEPTDNEHYSKKRKDHPRFGMPWTHDEEELLISLIKFILEHAMFKDRSSSELLGYLAEMTKRNLNSMGIKWLEFYRKGFVDMPSDLRDEWVEKLNIHIDKDKIKYLRESEEDKEKTREEESELRLKMSIAEKIVGTNLTNEQILELQKLFKDSDNDEFENFEIYKDIENDFIDVENNQEIDDIFSQE